MNIILIISDTLRKDYLGCYGNDWVRTPGIGGRVCPMEHSRPRLCRFAA